METKQSQAYLFGVIEGNLLSLLEMANLSDYEKLCITKALDASNKAFNNHLKQNKR
tara:strand:- start:398 stop:565 length:168 start_codon:yes stop_codon:yes gene_type:complete